MESVRREVVLPRSETVKRIGVVWQPKQKEAFRYVHDYFTQERVIFRNLCVSEKTVDPHSGSNNVTKKDLNWMGMPKPGVIDNFLETEFDVLFNLALKQNIVLDYITGLSKAKFKIGWSDSERNYFDLNIKIGRNKDALYLAKQQIFYLGELNKKVST